MNLVFWQNTISPHQLPYIFELSKINEVKKVILIVPIKESEERKKLGWSVFYEETDKFKIVLNPDVSQVNSFFLEYQENSHHFFSGIRAFPFVFNAFKISLKYKIKRSIIAETPFFYKKPPFLHFIRQLIFDYKYYKYIYSFYAIGSTAAKWYSKLYKGPIINFKYCTNNKQTVLSNPDNSILKLVFVGNFIKLKNIEIVIKALSKLKDKNIEFHLIGDGPLKNKLTNMIKKRSLTNNVFFHGVVNNEKIPQILSQFDVLILPSKFDGWGAVVNEALSVGLYAIVSNRCGSKDLIDDNKERGIVVRTKLKDIVNILNFVTNNLEYINKTRLNRIQWATKHISPGSVAKEFILSLKDKNI
ncbi:MAG: glycosyltransferase family 4 protein [Bacteroidales bacterium]